MSHIYQPVGRAKTEPIRRPAEEQVEHEDLLTTIVRAYPMG